VRTRLELDRLETHQTEEALTVQKRQVLALTLVFLVVGVVAPVFAQESGATSAAGEIGKWSIITAGFALAFAAAFGALGQSRGLAAAAEAIARNPSASNDIRFLFILGLVLIESLVIYVLLISLILFFLKPFGG
jgi:F-type H+-transporting ATPase subunit c